jgi:hypothetical protein
MWHLATVLAIKSRPSLTEKLYNVGLFCHDFRKTGSIFQGIKFFQQRTDPVARLSCAL